MKKIMGLVILVIVFMSLTACNSNAEPQPTTKAGLSVNENGKYEWTTVSEYETVLCVYSDDVIVSGCAEADSLIMIDDDVKRITFSDLSQGNYKINVMISTEEPFELCYKGNNQVYVISGGTVLNVIGENPTDNLDVSGEIDSFSDISFSNGQVCSAFINSGGDVSFIGNTSVIVTPTPHEFALENIHSSRIRANGRIIVDIESGCIVSVKENRSYYSMISEKEISIRENNQMIEPKNGYVDYYQYDGIYTTFDQSGKLVKNITIEGLN